MKTWYSVSSMAGCEGGSTFDSLRQAIGYAVDQTNQNSCEGLLIWEHPTTFSAKLMKLVVDGEEYEPEQAAQAITRMHGYG